MAGPTSDTQKKVHSGWLVFSLVLYWLVALGFLGYGIYAIYEVNHLRNQINSEINFFVNNTQTDSDCIQIDKKHHISIQCPVESTDITFKEITVTWQPDNSAAAENQNDESLYINFQDGIVLPGMNIQPTFKITPITTNPTQDLTTNYFDVDFSNDVQISSTGSLIFGETATINSEYTLPAYAGTGWSQPDLYRSFNLIFIGNFNDQAYTLTQRCSADLKVSGSSLYVLVASDQSAKICSCVKSFSSYNEYCSPKLVKFGGISSAVS